MKDENDTKTADLLVDGGALAPHQQDSAIIAHNVGRPKVHESAAARQKAYRARMRETGKRVVSRTVVDRRAGDALITSDTIVIPSFYRIR